MPPWNPRIPKPRIGILQGTPSWPGDAAGPNDLFWHRRGDTEYRYRVTGRTHIASYGLDQIEAVYLGQTRPAP